MEYVQFEKKTLKNLDNLKSLPSQADRVPLLRAIGCPTQFDGEETLLVNRFNDKYCNLDFTLDKLDRSNQLYDFYGIYEGDYGGPACILLLPSALASCKNYNHDVWGSANFGEMTVWFSGDRPHRKGTFSVAKKNQNIEFEMCFNGEKGRVKLTRSTQGVYDLHINNTHFKRRSPLN